MNKNAIYIIFVYLIALSSFGNDYIQRKIDVEADSLLIKELADSLRSDFVKNEIKELLNRISDSKKIFHPFCVDVYKRQKFKYAISYKTELTISDL
ncbi:MAG: hypothetical protein KKD38_09010, partial [Candidatus Delongbacteria bacterium]|nr:hypothetical protein [Candidatus Delongbacteria bacterium]MCG2760650.1 hypothetical protein [Candidatus Delongbacteria bacterium]